MQQLLRPDSYTSSILACQHSNHCFAEFSKMAGGRVWVAWDKHTGLTLYWPYSAKNRKHLRTTLIFSGKGIAIMWNITSSVSPCITSSGSDLLLFSSNLTPGSQREIFIVPISAILRKGMTRNIQRLPQFCHCLYKQNFACFSLLLSFSSWLL